MVWRAGVGEGNGGEEIVEREGGEEREGREREGRERGEREIERERERFMCNCVD